MNQFKQLNAVAGFLILVSIICWLVGFALNIYKIFHLPGFEGHIGEAVIRIISVVPLWPLGGIVGYF